MHPTENFIIPPPSRAPVGLGVLYRINYLLVGNGVDGFGEPYPVYNIKLTLERYKILKPTPKGVWVQCYRNKGGKKFVNLCAHKKFANPTVAGAKTDFIVRKKKYINIMKSRISDTEEAIKQIEKYQEK